MKSVAGYRGWFWLFVIIGGFTVLSALFMSFWLSDSIETPHSLFLPYFSFFTEHELRVLRSRVSLNDPEKSGRKQHIRLDAFRKAARESLDSLSQH